MPQSANTAVYRGREGTGAAQILGGSIDPLKVMMANKAKDEARIAAEQEAKKTQRDKDLSDLMKFSPEAAWDPFKKQVKDKAREMLRWGVDQQIKGVKLGDPQVQLQLKEMQDGINLLASRSMFLKNEKDTARKAYTEGEKSKYFDAAYYDRKLNDIYYDENGNGHPIESIDVNAPNALLNDPGGYHIDEIAKDFVKGLGTNLLAHYNRTDDHFNEEEFKSKLYRRDRNGKMMYDENGNPMYNFIPEVRTAAMQNDLIRRYVDNIAKGNKEMETEILREILTPYDSISSKSSPSHFSKTTGNGNKKEYDYEIVFGKDNAYNDYQTAIDNDGLLGKETVTMNIPNIVKDIHIGDSNTIKDVQGFHQDGEGNRYVITTSRTSGDRVREELVDFDKSVPAIRNALRTRDEKEGFDKAVNDFIEQSDQAPDYYIDQPKLNQITDRLFDLSTNREALKNVMREYGIENVNTGNSWRPTKQRISGYWIEGQPYIDIEGQTFYKQEYGEDGTPIWEQDDTEKLKEFLINKIPSEFRTNINDPLGILNSNQNGGNTQQRGGSADDPEGIR